MGTTPSLAIPYVEPADALANFPVQDKAKADRLEAIHYRAQGARLRVSALAVPAATETTVLLDNAIGALIGITYTSGTGTFTITTAGTYLVNANLTWSASETTGFRHLRLLKNGALFDQRGRLGPTSTGATEQLSLTRTLILAANDTLNLAAYSSVATSLVPHATFANVALELYRLGL
jgi:hypothetical protein